MSIYSVNSLYREEAKALVPSSQVSKTSLAQKIHRYEVAKLKLQQKIITHLETKEHELDQFLPDHAVQKKVDQFVHTIERKFAKLSSFNRWINDNGKGHWIKRVALFLAKLPLRAARNILGLLLKCIKLAVTAINHPLKTALRLAKYLTRLAFQLTEPETWTMLGVGMIGFSAGQALMGNPLSTMGFILGAALTVGGLGLGLLKTALKAESSTREKHLQKYMQNQLKSSAETLTTSFLMGIIMGSIQKAISDHKLAQARLTMEDAESFAKRFVQENNFPNYTRLEMDPSGKIIITWEKQQLHSFTHQELFPRVNVGHGITSLRLEITPNGVTSLVDYGIISKNMMEFYSSCHQYTQHFNASAFQYQFPQPMVSIPDPNLAYIPLNFSQK